ncbi:substrate-binding domain-containing protein [Gracilibacillus phocaeensis]|uniref:substrate-binding domain-containing protein n=1 Tax=Gracilibacillus phocaeensis TaxID=2042304 RepID=UPI001030880F|nr:substrate-binding domain-containing protein [Gracilibacillus phocaeensis]
MLLCQSFEEELSDPYFLSIRQGVENHCKELGLDCAEIYRLSNLNLEQPSINEELDGLIVIGGIDTTVVEQLSRKINHFVYIDYSPNEDEYDSVIIDLKKATNIALDHLLKLNHKKIGFLGGDQTEHTKKMKRRNVDERYLAYKEKMKKMGLYDSKHEFIGDFTMSDGYRLMNVAIQQGNLPEAFFIASDPLAIGALRALQEAQIQVPEKVAIVSFDDIEMAKYASSPLSTVRVPAEEMGNVGAKLMMERLMGRDIPLKVTVPIELIERESCGAMKR